MIRIAVCDDNVADLQKMTKIICDYSKAHQNHEIMVQEFSSPYALLSAVENGQFHNIYILDIIMPHLSGIKLGHYIRMRNSACAIIFCTVTPEYALESYCVQAQNYLVKPIKAAELIQTLEQALQRLTQNQVNGISIHTPEGLELIPFFQIVYLELSARRILFHKTNGLVSQSLLLRGSFEEALADLLAEPRFLQVHKSFVVNMEHITKYMKSVMQMDDGSNVPISARRRSYVVNQYLLYLDTSQKSICTDRFTPHQDT